MTGESKRQKRSRRLLERARSPPPSARPAHYGHRCPRPPAGYPRTRRVPHAGAARAAPGQDQRILQPCLPQLRILSPNAQCHHWPTLRSSKHRILLRQSSGRRGPGSSQECIPSPCEDRVRRRGGTLCTHRHRSERCMGRWSLVREW